MAFEGLIYQIKWVTFKWCFHISPTFSTGCTCNKYRTPKEICNQTNCADAVQAAIKQDGNGKQSLILAQLGGATLTIPIENNYGVNDFDFLKRDLELVVMTDEGTYGILATEFGQMQTLLNDPTTPINNNTSNLRRRRAVVTSPLATQGIRSPVICVNIGEAVMWQVGLINDCFEIKIKSRVLWREHLCNQINMINTCNHADP